MRLRTSKLKMLVSSSNYDVFEMDVDVSMDARDSVVSNEEAT